MSMMPPQTHTQRSLLIFTVGWIRIAEGILMVLSLGQYYPNLEMRYLVRDLDRRVGTPRHHD